MAERRRTTMLAIGLAIAGMLLTTLPASAHPLGNFTINRAIAIEIGSRVDIRYLVDMAEIPAFEAIQDLDLNGDGERQDDEVDAYAAATCERAATDLVATIDGSTIPVEEVAPASIAFPDGAGGLETLRLECTFALEVSQDPTGAHRLEIRDETESDRIGWHEVTARARGNATVTDSDVPETSPSAELTAYPVDALTTPPDVRSGALAFTLDAAAEAPSQSVDSPVGRISANDPLAALVGGELSVPVVLLALLVAMGLGAVHALSPGHGKTLVAAYVLGAGGDARSAVQIGLSVAISHTAGVFALGVLILGASELFLPERVIGWLSLVSGIVVAVLGLFLVIRQVSRIRARRAGRAAEHGHDHGHDHGDGHDHGHSHEPPTGGLTWRSAVALGFAGGAVPSASAVIVLLVAISSDRLVFGTVLIAMFGIGMAVVLGGLGLIIARVGAAATRSRSGLLGSPRIRQLGQWVPVAAGVVVLVTGLTFATIAATQLS
ncbi:MAG: hypothetical protein ABIY36_04475 [Candidatus Limnocylindria bacterium]